uniref:Sas10 C-terminal domain-containing protein n=1 Tax=Biomphalaria glabrata TaxID=6526 RepID=A0A2C9KBM2_BIOGL
MYEAIPEEQMEASDASGDESTDDEDVKPNNSIKRQRLELTGSEEEEDDDEDEKEKVEESEEKEPENRPIGYEIMKNKPKKKTAPNNPRVKHREKFRKAKIRRKGKYRDYRPEINKYQGEASGIRAGIIRSVRLK